MSLEGELNEILGKHEKHPSEEEARRKYNRLAAESNEFFRTHLEELEHLKGVSSSCGATLLSYATRRNPALLLCWREITTCSVAMEKIAYYLGRTYKAAP